MKGFLSVEMKVGGKVELSVVSSAVTRAFLTGIEWGDLKVALWVGRMADEMVVQMAVMLDVSWAGCSDASKVGMWAVETAATKDVDWVAKKDVDWVAT